jgi:hypothetical protein
MSNSATGTTAKPKVEFGAENLIANAKVYRKDRRIVDAAAKGYDSVDDAIAALRTAWTVLEKQVEEGAGYTPDTSLGFGSDNSAQIAEGILGRRTSLASTRRSFADMGR